MEVEVQEEAAAATQYTEDVMMTLSTGDGAPGSVGAAMDTSIDHGDDRHREAQEEVELDVDELVRQCLYIATKMLTDGGTRTDRKVDRVHKLQELLDTQDQGTGL